MMGVHRKAGQVFVPCKTRTTWGIFYRGHWLGVACGNHVERLYQGGVFVSETVINVDSTTSVTLSDGHGYFRDILVHLFREDIPKGLY